MNTANSDVTIRQIMDQSGVRFGTSGARGLAADMTAPVCFAYTAAFLQVVAPPAGEAASPWGWTCAPAARTSPAPARPPSARPG
jgi:hypothetical protein